MRYARMLAVLGLILIPASYARAQRIAIGVGIGGPAYVGPPPACAYGYYPYYPYACAPYGYYGPEWFSGRVFIGAGPWFHGFYGRPYNLRPGFYARPGWRDFDDRGSRRFHDEGHFRGGESHSGGFRGGRR